MSIVFSVIQDGLNFPFRLLLDQGWCWFDIGSSWESFIIVVSVGFDPRAVECCFPLAIHPGIYLDCVILCEIVITQHCKWSMPAWFQLLQLS